MRHRKLLALMGLALPVVANAWMFPASVYPKPANKYTFVTPADSAAFVSSLKNGWSSWKSKFVQGDGTVADPSGFTPNSGKVSEGIGYGMLLAVLNNDSTTFRKIFEAGERSYWYSYAEPYGWYGWMMNGQTNVDNMWGAPDADEDVALACIFASALIRMKYWPEYSFKVTHKQYDGSAGVQCTVTVDQKARDLLVSISRYATSQGSGFPASNYIQHNTSQYAQKNAAGTKISLQNLSYFAPAHYRVFMSYMAYNGLTSNTDWEQLITNEYAVLKAQPGSSVGMARDWSLLDGSYVKLDWMTSSLFGHVGDMWYDAIRVPYRVGLAAYWYKDAGAVDYAQKVWGGGVVSASSPRMYTNLGSSPTASLPGLEITPRAMWAVSAYGGRAAGNAAATTAAATFHNSLKSTGYGNTNQYFDESLGLLGGLVAGGSFPNIWDDLKASFPDTSAVLSSFTANKKSCIYYKDSVTFSIKFNKMANCTLTVQGLTSKAKYTSVFKTTASGTYTAYWKSGLKGGLTMFNSDPGEYVKATLRWSGTVPAAAPNSIDSIKMCASATTCPSPQGVGIENSIAPKASLQRLADGSMVIRQPWFAQGGSVRVRLRNAAGVSLYQSNAVTESGAVRVPSLSLAPGWYAVETETNGQHATQSFTLSR